VEDLPKEHAGLGLRASTGYDSVANAEIVFIYVGTPPRPNSSANLSYIKSRSTSIGNNLKTNLYYFVIVVKVLSPRAS
jgi:UDPglucose 6-dehydrogenase